MPLVLKHITAINQSYIWHITEPAQHLVTQLEACSDFVSNKKLTFNNEEAWRQWLASRCLIEEATGEQIDKFKKNKNGCLYIEDQRFQISVSHTDDWTAIGVSSKPIGIDIQTPSKKLERIAQKFIDYKTLHNLRKNKKDYIHFLHLYWGIKEALFKAYSLGKVDFIRHLHIKPFQLEDGMTTAKLIKEDIELSYSVSFHFNENYYLCITTLKD